MACDDDNLVMVMTTTAANMSRKVRAVIGMTLTVGTITIVSSAFVVAAADHLLFR